MGDGNRITSQFVSGLIAFTKLDVHYWPCGRLSKFSPTIQYTRNEVIGAAKYDRSALQSRVFMLCPLLQRITKVTIQLSTAILV
jgi:hypothetical protein